MVTTVFRVFSLVVCCTALLACAHQPTVYLYAKYLTPQERESLEEALGNKEFAVQSNNFEFPTTIEQNTILYSLVLSKPALLTHIEQVTEANGFTISRQQAMTEGNHWYTKDSAALFLYSLEGAKKGLRKADVARSYIASGCDTDITLTLQNDGSYQFLGTIADAFQKQHATGTWLFRQRPYVELRATGADYSSQYFEVSREYTRDQISALTFIRLTPLQSYLLDSDCVLEFALRE
ncbi:hypothetical protein GCM10011338_16600 [Alteromonas lipolytica]|nr:hypothetical protein GCM10011338_16600 [Alteromonas lipolytica]